MKDLSIIIPAYNEEERIQPTLESYSKELEKMRLNYELLVIDDGSTDGTVALVELLKETIPHLRLLVCPQNKGKGAAVKEGMLHAVGAIRVMVDADGSIQASELPKLLSPILEGQVDISIGSRYVEGAIISIPQPWFRKKWSRFANVVIQKILLPGIVDTQCGFKAFRDSVAETVFEYTATSGWSFDLEALAFAQLQGFQIQEVPICWADDARSKGHIKQLPRTIAELFRIKKKIRKEQKMSSIS